MFTKQFWKGAAERAIKTAAQGFIYGTGLSMLVTGLGDGTGIAFVDVPWLLGVQSAVVMAVFSVVTSIGNPDFTAGQTPVVIEHDTPTAVVNVAPVERTVDLDAPDHI